MKTNLAIFWLFLLPLFVSAQHLEDSCDIAAADTIHPTRYFIMYQGFTQSDSNGYASIMFDTSGHLHEIWGDTAKAIEALFKHSQTRQHELDSITRQYQKLSTLTGKFITGIKAPWQDIAYLPVWQRLYAHLTKNGWWFDLKPKKKKP